jgi:molybdopterin converting factor small subunit
VNVTVRYHGIIGDMIDRKTQHVEMPDGSTVTDLLAAVTSDDEDSKAILKQSRAFIDGKQADRATPLADGTEVTFMRPIAGGTGFASGAAAISPQQGMSLRKVVKEDETQESPLLRAPLPLRRRSRRHTLRERSDRLPLKPLRSCHPLRRSDTPYFDAVDPAGKLSPPVCGSGCAPGA